MPVTLRKNVNGQAVAIKLSILDVLFGVPPPKAKASKPALASRSPQKSDNLVTAWLSENTAVDNTGKDVSTKDKEKVASKQGTDENGPNFTDAENAKLIEMKAAGKTWREIASEMNKSQSSLKEHFKKIRTPSEAEGQPSENAKPGGREAPSTKVSKEQHGTGNIVNRNPTVEGDETNVKKLQKKEAKSKTEVINNGSKVCKKITQCFLSTGHPISLAFSRRNIPCLSITMP